MIRFRHAFCGCLLTAIVGTAMLPAASEPARAGGGRGVEAGYIADFDWPRDQYVLRRGADEVPVTLTGRLMDGDVIEVTTDTGRIHLVIGRDRDVVVGKAESPYKVEADDSMAGFWSGLLAWAAEQFDAMNEETEATAASQMSRGGAPKLEIPLLARSPQRLAAGRRSIAFAWSTGTSPFTVNLGRKGSAKPLVAGSTPYSSWTSPPIDLTPGSYWLTVAEKNGEGNRVEAEIVVVERGAVPEPPSDARLDALPSDLGATVFAAWLSGQENGMWMLESYQRVVPVAERFRPARLLAHKLIGGEPLPPP